MDTDGVRLEIGPPEESAQETISPSFVSFLLNAPNYADRVTIQCLADDARTVMAL
jgi:hypothetical protein